MRDHHQRILQNGVSIQARCRVRQFPATQRLHDGTQFDHAGAVDVLDEILNVIIGRTQHDILRAALLHQMTIAQNRDIVAKAQRLVQIMGDEDNRFVQFLLQINQNGLHIITDQRVERRKRLVHQQDIRIRCQTARQTHALPHAAR